MMSVGRKLLLDVLRSTTQSAIAERVQKSQPAVAAWASGDKRPGFHARHALAEAYSIDVHAWDRAWVAPAPTQVAPALTQVAA